MTDYDENRPASPDDFPLASQRAEFLGQLVAAQFDLEAAVADLMRDGAPASAVLDGRNQLATLNALRQQVASADMKSLAAMRGDIATVVASCQATVRQAEQSASISGAQAATLASAQQTAREAVGTFEDAYFKQHKFDRYLQFMSKEDEKAFREREAERQREIERAKALHTPGRKAI
jgi:hypothetical protein